MLCFWSETEFSLINGRENEGYDTKRNTSFRSFFRYTHLCSLKLSFLLATTAKLPINRVENTNAQELRILQQIYRSCLNKQNQNNNTNICRESMNVLFRSGVLQDQQLWSFGNAGRRLSPFRKTASITHKACCSLGNNALETIAAVRGGSHFFPTLLWCKERQSEVSQVYIHLKGKN